MMNRVVFKYHQLKLFCFVYLKLNFRDKLLEYKASTMTCSQFVYTGTMFMKYQYQNYICRIGDYKLMVGNPGLYSDWYRPEQITDHVSEDDAPCKAKGRLAKEEIVRLYNLKG